MFFDKKRVENLVTLKLVNSLNYIKIKKNIFLNTVLLQNILNTVSHKNDEIFLQFVPTLQPIYRLAPVVAGGSDTQKLGSASGPWSHQLKRRRRRNRDQRAEREDEETRF